MMSLELLQSPAPLWFIDNLAYVHVPGEATGGAYSLCELRAAAGSMPPLHVHHRDDEAFYVLEGELTLFVGERERALSAGRAAVAPRGTPHTYRIQSAEARLLVVNSPAGFDQFLLAAGDQASGHELPPADRPADPAALGRAAAEYGIEILGPPGMLPGEL
jgi:mannose-6-phosphate isomerase-like protein (cupin superfamily)